MFILFLLVFFLLKAELFPFGKNKLNLDSGNWKSVRSIHFNVYYPEGSEELGLETMRLAEEAYVLLANRLQHELTDDIPVVVYPSHMAFQNTNILPDMIGEGTGGFTEALKMRVVVPFNGSWSEFRHVLTHEMVHAFQFNIMFSDSPGTANSWFGLSAMPLWIAEGMAEYYSSGFDETADMVMRDALFNDNWVTLMDLTGMRLGNPYLLYKEGQAFYYFLEKEYGAGVAGEMFRDIRDLGNLQEAVKISTGKSMEELNLQWIRFFKKRYYPLAARGKFDDEDAQRITDHLKTESSMNICPAVSPDGKKIAYITNRDIYSNVVIRELATGKEENVKTLVKGNTAASFEEMHLIGNNLNWSADGKIIAFVAQSNARDVIYLVDPENGKIRNAIKTPFRTVMDPALSPDGKYVVFAGEGASSMDLYLYSVEKMSIKRLTNDQFAERNPDITPDNRYVIFSGNWNNEGVKDRDDYNLYRLDIETGARELLCAAGGHELQADISPDGTKLLYVSSRTGIYNAYVMNLSDRTEYPVTDVLSGIFSPRWFPDGKKMLFVSYQDQGYDIFTRDIPQTVKPVPAALETIRTSPEFLPSYIDYGGVKFDNYGVRLSPDWLIFGLTGTFNYGFVGIAQVGMSDLMRDHSVMVTTNYVRQDGDNDFNFQAAYWYLKQRWDFGLGAFRQKNPYMIFSLENINDLIHDVNFGTEYMNNYGMYGIASYPFTRFLRMDLQASVSRYERDYSVDDKRSDVYENLNKVSAALCYDTVLWGAMVPMDGFRGKVEVEQSMDLTGHDCVYTSMNLDLRRYFLFRKRYVLALRGMGGKIVGPDSDSFKYYLGGFNTLRGHPLWEYSGENMFLFSSEFRFAFIEGMKFGFPLFLGIGQIGGALFTDFGSAWDGDYHFLNGKKNKFDDFKMDMGFGFRFVIYPIIILKLDYAWPYYMTSFGKGDVIFSIGFEY